jgi:hypothetical protein
VGESACSAALRAVVRDAAIRDDSSAVISPETFSRGRTAEAASARFARICAARAFSAACAFAESMRRGAGCAPGPSDAASVGSRGDAASACALAGADPAKAMTRPYPTVGSANVCFLPCATA